VRTVSPVSPRRLTGQLRVVLPPALTVQEKQPRTAGSYPNAAKVGRVRSMTTPV
jgi:hypothetical protein